MPVEITDEELVAHYAGYAIDHDTKARFRGWLERRLLVDRCLDCRAFHEPPGPICPTCWSTRSEPTPVAGTGTIYMAIFLHQGPPAEGVDYSTPYPVVTVELDDQPGLRFTSTVVGSPNEEIVIGRRVRLEWLERGDAPFPVFRLENVG